MSGLFAKPKQKKAPEQERITDQLIGTGEHMCTCAALVADIIVEQGQEDVSLSEKLKAVCGKGHDNI